VSGNGGIRQGGAPKYDRGRGMPKYMGGYNKELI